MGRDANRSACVKRQALGHTKMKRLCRKLDIPLWQGVGLLESIWHLTAGEAPQGNIGKLSDEDIALGIDYRGNESEMIAALVHCVWLERSDKFRLVVHDWFDHCEDSVHMKLVRQGLSFVRADGTLMRPKFSRLPQTEREAAAHKYDSVRTDTQEQAHPVRTASAQNDSVKADLNLNLNLNPNQATASTTTTPLNGQGANGTKAAGRRRHYPELTKTKTAIRTENFEDVGDPFVKRLYTLSCEAAVKGGCDPKLVTDELLARLVKKCRKKNQQSAGLFLDTIPAVVETWAITEETE